ncbi:alcohol oxidase [Sistotremastrum suecicum HHB10207 ss-3]|uniref:Alcohol oxidase n=1 Tax=Sistotremastrum suecicum HHB10207 ss-3 TaxID=1314776 RepID=A0A166AGA2_9AGAM|nr:alcohol oxidase [Sistotremastrum suecicum HHB10207 ss-3]
MGSSNSIVSDPSSLESQYDFIIVGAGAGGCVLANKLSEDPSVSVLLIEAGKSHLKEIKAKIPMTFPQLLGGPCDWNYETTPQTHIHNRTFGWPRGKILGGSTSIHALMYHHCAPSDFDEWEADAPGWSYETLRPYFKNSETYHPHPLHSDVDMSYRGTEGPVQITNPPRVPVTHECLESVKAVGIPYTPDFNTPNGTLGCSHMQGFIDTKGQRSSAATAYLEPALSRPNLTVVTMTTVTQLLFFPQSSSPKVKGVELARTAAPGKKPSPQRWTVDARNEVILAGGTINTPQTLLLSGIGPSEQLKKFNIPVVKDLPAVGKNLADHVMSGSVAYRAAPGTSIDYLTTFWGSFIPLIRWLLTGKSILGGLVPPGAAFVRSDDPKLPYSSKASPDIVAKDATSGKNAPDLELIYAPLSFLTTNDNKAPGTNVIAVLAALLRPKSKGTITLASTDPFDKPLIDPNYFSDPNDIEVLAKGVRLCLRIPRTEPLVKKLRIRESNSDKKDVFWLGEQDPDTVTNEDIREWIVNNCATLFHPVGTARMGSSQETSVVDASLRVHGVANLRIVDASILPNQLSGHSTAPLIAISGRAADIIKSEYTDKFKGL